MANRRKTLTRVVAFVALGGALLAAYPFLASMRPTAIAKARGFLQVDLTHVPEGSYLIAKSGLGRDVIFYKPSAETIDYLIELNSKVSGPIISGPIEAPAFVYAAGSTHLAGGNGCNVRPTEQGEFGENWYAGWSDPCHEGAWDYAGRTIVGQNGSSERVLPNLQLPYRVEWDEEVATLYRKAGN